ncbi:MAG TPA: hypothetical protein VFT29_06270 [Gemmatimonadaceae bacterium]|nr:hypothetical protein [Gemmatimonadaceae bacterium]
MKVTVDLDALLADGKITAAEAERLRGHAGKETVSTALSALVTMGVLAVVAAVTALVPDAKAAMFTGVLVTSVGIFAVRLDESGWGALRQMLLVVGALLGATAFLILEKGSTSAWAIVYGCLAWLAFTVSKNVPDRNSRPLVGRKSDHLAGRIRVHLGRGDAGRGILGSDAGTSLGGEPLRRVPDDQLLYAVVRAPARVARNAARRRPHHARRRAGAASVQQELIRTCR